MYTYPEVTDSLLTEIVASVRSVGDPARVVFFGSRARGDHRLDSDIDLLIVEETAKDNRARCRRYGDALASCYPGRTVVVTSLREVEEWIDVLGHLPCTGLKQGRVLYERHERAYAPTPVDQFMAEGEEFACKTCADLAREWFEEGNEDLMMCRLAFASEGPYGKVCFHAHQAAERYLTGFLACHGVEIPRSHVLEDLAKDCPGLEPLSEALEIPLRDLTGPGTSGRCF